MLIGAPPGSIGAGNKSGWITTEIFVEFLKHFIKHSKCSKDNNVLLLMDNHETHISLESIDLSKDNEITIITYPPHCSHKLQPLDRTTYSSFKRHYNSACDNWLMNHPGKPLTIYDLAGVVGEAYLKSFTPAIIQSGFRVSGCYPVNRDIFTDDEYLTSYVTDRPDPHSTTTETSSTSMTATNSSATATTSSNFETATTSSEAATTSSVSEPIASSSQILSLSLSPEVVRPYPKAGERKQPKKNRKRGKSRILTDTREKTAMLVELMKKQAKKVVHKEREIGRNQRCVNH